MEHLPYRGESPTDRLAYSRYLEDVKRGKSLLQLIAVRDAVTPLIKRSWSARTFTPISTSQGIFDDIICNISYHFGKHGARYGTIANMTIAAQDYFRQNHSKGQNKDGVLKFPCGIFETDGRIITFF